MLKDAIIVETAIDLSFKTTVLWIVPKNIKPLEAKIHSQNLLQTFNTNFY